LDNVHFWYFGSGVRPRRVDPPRNATLLLLNFEVIERTQRASGDYSLVFLTASSMASFNVGVYYVLASLTNLKVFYWWTVPFRIVTFSVFMLAVANGLAPAGFIGVGLWELVGALATGGTLIRERNLAKVASR
jgi:hypothetical protein